jgi:hypothetical protein
MVQLFDNLVYGAKSGLLSKDDCSTSVGEGCSQGTSALAVGVVRAELHCQQVEDGM